MRAATLLGRLVLAVTVGVSCSGCSLLFGSKSHIPTFNYTIAPGDTIYELSLRFGVDPEDIIDINDVDDPKALQIGSILKIPSGGKKTAPVSTARASLNLKPDQSSKRTVLLTSAQRYVGHLVIPVHGGSLSSTFGNRWNNFHEGIDFPASEGTAVYAAHDGVVVYSDNVIRGYGNMVIVRGEGLLTVYAHNSKNLVDRGEKVSQGDKISLVGSTGHSTGAHLHFETRVRNSEGKYVAVDPLVFFKGR